MAGQKRMNRRITNIQSRQRRTGNTGRHSHEREQKYSNTSGNHGHHRKRRKTRNPFIGIKTFDYNLLIVIMFLLCFGLIMLYSTSYYQAEIKFGNQFHYLIRQGIFSLASILFMMFIAHINYHFWMKLSGIIYLGAIISVLLLLTPLGITRNEATRWIGITETINVQPAEICKIAIILFIPSLLVKIDRHIREWKFLGIVTIFAGLMFFLVFVISDNLSSALIIFGIAFLMVFVMHPKTMPFLALGGIGAGGLAVFIHFVIRQMETSSNFRFRRIIAWLNPEKYASDLSYQTMQALYAIGSGGLFGKGLGNSAQKMIIPEAQNDMIFSVICEELGMFGVAIVILLFSILLYRLTVLAQNAPDLYGSLIAVGIFAHIAMQVIFNIAVVTNVMPNTGITLPFISYGGSSILFLMTEMGIALNISAETNKKNMMRQERRYVS